MFASKQQTVWNDPTDFCWPGLDALTWLLKILWLLWMLPSILRKILARWINMLSQAKVKPAVEVARVTSAPPLPSFAQGSEFNAWRSDAGLY